jgi:hypothetical protein
MVAALEEAALGRRGRAATVAGFSRAGPPLLDGAGAATSVSALGVLVVALLAEVPFHGAVAAALVADTLLPGARPSGEDLAAGTASVVVIEVPVVALLPGIFDAIVALGEDLVAEERARPVPRGEADEQDGAEGEQERESEEEPAAGGSGGQAWKGDRTREAV